MSRRLNLIVTIITTLLALFVGLQLKDPDSSLMRLFHRSTTLSAYLQSPRRVFAQQSPFSSTPVINMASNTHISDPSSSTSHEAQDSSFKDSEGRPLGLPEPPTSEEEEATKLDLSGGSDSVKLDHLGPLVVNKDGTLSRIGNWDQMTELEKRNTLRVLGKRNQLRTRELKQGGDDSAVAAAAAGEKG